MHVDHRAPAGGDGRSWPTAFRHLSDALAAAAAKPWSVREILVAGGTYRPDESAAHPGGTGDRSSTFALVDGVPVRGGFAGFASGFPYEQNPVATPTILSADLEGNDLVGFGQRADNAFHVVTAGASGGLQSTRFRMEAMTIRGGHAVIQAGLPVADAVGAGVRLRSGSLEFVSVTIKDNWANQGGGVDGSTGTHLLLTDSAISGNKSTTKGGGVHAAGTVSLHACDFTQNVSTNEGGGLRAIGPWCEAVGCTFTSNAASFSAAIDSTNSLLLLDSAISGNQSTLQGGAVRSSGGSVRVEGCLVDSNVTNFWEAVAIQGIVNAPVIVQDSTFIGNQGSGLRMACCACTVRGCDFLVNGDCGAIIASANAACVAGGPAVVEQCRFHGNFSEQDSHGAGLEVVQRPAIVRDCDFVGNIIQPGGAGHGAGLYFSNGPVAGSRRVESCRFIGNVAQASAILRAQATAPNPIIEIVNVTAVHNTSIGTTGAFNLVNAKASGCILWGNTGGNATLEGKQLALNGTSTITDSCIQGLSATPGAGNIGGNPLFLSVDGPDGLQGNADADLRIHENSPCIDRLALSLGSICGTDFEGLMRSVDVAGVGLSGSTTIDMGAHENGGSFVADADGDTLDDVCALASGFVTASCTDPAVPVGALLVDGGDADLDGVPDACEIEAGEPDCDGNGVPDAHDFLLGRSVDCDGDGAPDSCAIALGVVADCNANGVPDACDLANATSKDLDLDGVPDDCGDCDGDGVADGSSILAGRVPDCDGNGRPDSCDLAGGAPDDDGDGVPDVCDADCDGDGTSDSAEIAAGAADCDASGVPDSCELAQGILTDFNANGVADACEADCDGDAVPDFIAILFELVPDANGNGVPDPCEDQGDLTGDGRVDGADLAEILGHWGRCSSDSACIGDLDGDGLVGGADLAIVLGAWQ